MKILYLIRYKWCTFLQNQRTLTALRQRYRWYFSVSFNCLLQAYHSSFVNTNENIGNMAFLTFKTNFRGPVTNFNPEFQLDIIDEALYFFRANVFFRTYEIKVISIVLH